MQRFTIMRIETSFETASNKLKILYSLCCKRSIEDLEEVYKWKGINIVTENFKLLQTVKIDD